MKKLSNYELKERLACLNEIYKRLSDYSHVFDMNGEGEKLVKLISDMSFDHAIELDRRGGESC